VRIENISLRFNLVSNSSRGHRKRTKKLKERRIKSGEPLCSHEELRSKKKMEKKRPIKKKTEAT
jgi:hypothetical protein